MDVFDIILVIYGSICLATLGGHSLLTSYFRHKGELIDRTFDRAEKGEV